MKKITRGHPSEWVTAARQKEAGAGQEAERRNAERFSRRAAARKYNMNTIEAYLTTGGERSQVLLADLGVLGAGLIARSELPLEQPVGVELVVGYYMIETFGVVRSCVRQGAWYRLGVEFTMLDAPDAQFLQELDSNLVLRDF